MFDAHTHLNSDQLYTDRRHHVYDFIDAGGTHIVSVGIDGIYNTRNIEVATLRLEDPRQQQCIIKSTVGLHPCSIGTNGLTNKQDVDEQLLILHSQFDKYGDHLVAVGECGVDAHRGDYQSQKKLQWYGFERQCALAQHLQLPIVIHSRSQRPDTLAILQQFPDLKIYLHCWGYTSREIVQASSSFKKLRIGFCGNTTYPKAQELKESLQLAREIQNQGGCAVVIETDAPYLAPQPHRGKQNTLKYLADSGNEFAKIINITPEVLFEKTKNNACSLYNLS